VQAGLAALTLLVACSGGGRGDAKPGKVTTPPTIGREGSKVIEHMPAVEIEAPLAAYGLTYRVEEVAGDDVQTSTAELTVVRPFRSRVVTTVDDEVTSTRVADFGYLGQAPGADGHDSVLTAPPGPAPGDVRSDLVFAGDEGGEVRLVIDRPCQVHHLGAPALTGIIVPFDESEGITTDTCVDADGLILEEVTYDDEHRAISRWIATKLVIGPTVHDDDFRLPDVKPTPATEGGGSLQAVDPTTASEGRFWELPEPPEGFTRMGRYAIVPPQAASPDDEHSRAQVIAGVSDVFVRGSDLLVIEQGGTLGQVPPFGVTPHSHLIDLGELGKTAELFATATGTEIRVLIPPGRYVKVLGTLAPDELVAIAKSLVPIEGTGLVYL
jgi:hypothetical protein